MPDQSVQTDLDAVLVKNAEKIVKNYEKIEREWSKRETRMHRINVGFFILGIVILFKVLR